MYRVQIYWMINAANLFARSSNSSSRDRTVTAFDLDRFSQNLRLSLPGRILNILQGSIVVGWNFTRNVKIFHSINQIHLWPVAPSPHQKPTG